MKRLLIAFWALGALHAEELTITVYDRARFPREVSTAAFDALRSILKEARIDVMVVAGDPEAKESTLTQLMNPPKGGERAASCRARRDIALEIVPKAPAGQSYSQLGWAQPLAYAGLNVRVFDDRIRAAMPGQDGSYATILAHVIAHEIGHVLLRTEGHSRGGLMATDWGVAEYRWMTRSFMLFTKGQSQTMRDALSGIGCPDSKKPTGIPGLATLQPQNQ